MTVAAFTEIVSVSVHAISRFDKIAHARRNTISVWGDGNLGYITSLFLKYHFPKSKIVVFGTSSDKLADFTFADETHLVNEVPNGFTTDHAFECVGGNGSPIAIEQIIGLIKPEGTISILGVSEYPVPINTRMILEKVFVYSARQEAVLRTLQRLLICIKSILRLSITSAILSILSM